MATRLSEPLWLDVSDIPQPLDSAYQALGHHQVAVPTGTTIGRLLKFAQRTSIKIARGSAGYPAFEGGNVYLSLIHI